jgi:hypothetical protein
VDEAAVKHYAVGDAREMAGGGVLGESAVDLREEFLDAAEAIVVVEGGWSVGSGFGGAGQGGREEESEGDKAEEAGHGGKVTERTRGFRVRHGSG